MSDPNSVEALIARVTALVSAREPAGLTKVLAPTRLGTPFLAGTMAPSLAPTAVKLPSGIWVPSTAAAEPAPIDLMTTYVTSDEVGLPEGMAFAQDVIAGIDRDAALDFISHLLGRRQMIGADWPALDRELASAILKEPLRSKVLGLLGRRRVLLSPQGLLIAAKIALQTAVLGGSREPEALILAVLALQQGLVSSDEQEEAPLPAAHALFREIVRSQHFHAETYERVLITSFQARWRELPNRLRRGGVDLPAEFARATGVALDDVCAVGLALWTRVLADPSPPVAPATWMSSFGWDSDRMAQALALISTTSEELGPTLDAEERSLGIQWSFDSLRRHPVIRRPDGSLLVISPRLLIERVFGWLPIFDLVRGLEAMGDGRAARRAIGCLQDACELQALDSLRAITGDALPRMYDEEDLQKAYGRGRTADAAVDAGEAWIVMEVSSRQLQRESRVGDDRAALETDIERGIYQKAAQIHATIENLIADETRVTGAAAVAGRRYVPVLVVADGFPVNPMTTSLIERELQARALLNQPRVSQLRIIDQEELEMIESLVEDGQAGLLGLLDAWNTSRLRGVDMRSWLLTGRYEPGTPARLAGVYERAFRPAFQALGVAAESNHE